MQITKDNVIEYLKAYQLVESEAPDEIKTSVASQVLYTCFLNRFRWEMEEEHSQILAIYQQRVADVLEDLRERSDPEIVCVLECLDQTDRHLLDVIIMSWCQPRPRQFLSKLMHERCHRELIRKYHPTMLRLLDHYTLRNFRAEAFCRDCHLPVECLDYIWSDLVQREIVPVFSNDASGGYLGLLNSSQEDATELTINLKVLMELGLGRHSVVWEGCPRQFRDVIRSLLSDPALVREALQSSTAINYLAQVKYIYQHYQEEMGCLAPELAARMP